ncbi:hypothetical protein FACS189461_2240 [Spirochaetia bacterium]|nr:hypothetical protein FACS189461_2240 [Spirochaetia bacterium]
MARLLDGIKYLPYVLFHPFDGFYEAKFRAKGSVLAAAILFVLYGITEIVTAQYNGFIINYQHLYGIESSELFLSGTLPVALFFISNYSVTTLLNGNGRFRDIFMVTCYSLIPLIFFGLATTLVSNFLIIEELPILQAFYWIGVIWFLFLLFAGLCVVHEYTALQNVASLICTVIAAIIILFLSVLLLTLIDRVTSFAEVIFIEATKRWGR